MNAPTHLGPRRVARREFDAERRQVLYEQIALRCAITRARIKATNDLIERYWEARR